MDWLQTVILAIVEGITEYLPISSTGHMILTSAAMGIADDEFVKLYEVAIQLGAILAVVVLYWKKFFSFQQGWLQFYQKIILGVLPLLILGFLLHKEIEKLLGSPLVVGCTLFVGGIILLFVDKWFNKPQIDSVAKVDVFRALRIGFFQCLALLPGTSRSAATIVGGMQQKLTRAEAAEFSFFLAVPAMLAATGYDLLKKKDLLIGPGVGSDNLVKLAIGGFIAFLVAMAAIKLFINSLKKYGFKMWGVYRIIVGLLVFAAVYFGYLKA